MRLRRRIVVNTNTTILRRCNRYIWDGFVAWTRGPRTSTREPGTFFDRNGWAAEGFGRSRMKPPGKSKGREFNTAQADVTADAAPASVVNRFAPPHARALCHFLNHCRCGDYTIRVNVIFGKRCFAENVLLMFVLYCEGVCQRTLFIA